MVLDAVLRWTNRSVRHTSSSARECTQVQHRPQLARGDSVPSLRFDDPQDTQTQMLQTMQQMMGMQQMQVAMMTSTMGLQPGGGEMPGAGVGVPLGFFPGGRAALGGGGASGRQPPPPGAGRGQNAIA